MARSSTGSPKRCGPNSDAAIADREARRRDDGGRHSGADAGWGDLRANVYRPDGEGPWPTLLTRTPYGEENHGLLDPLQATREGFMIVLQDTRGRFAFEGEWRPFRFEREDGYDSVEWAARLAGSNGRVGMFSGSYVGSTDACASSCTPRAPRPRPTGSRACATSTPMAAPTTSATASCASPRARMPVGSSRSTCGPPATSSSPATACASTSPAIASHAGPQPQHRQPARPAPRGRTPTDPPRRRPRLLDRAPRRRRSRVVACNRSHYNWQHRLHTLGATSLP